MILVNIFSVCGFDNALSLKDCTDDDISYVEKFMRDEWAQIMKKKQEKLEKKSDEENYCTQMVNYFGELYEKNPSEFKFQPGHKKLIKELVVHVQRIVNCNQNGGLSHFVEKTSNNYKVDVNISENTHCQHYFLNRLMETAHRNENRKSGGKRYDGDIQNVAKYLRLIAGPFAYDTIQRNLDCSLPSLASTNRYIRSTSGHIVEGQLRCLQLKQYLIDKKLPPVVCLSMDETRIESAIQYDAQTNQIIGFTLPLNKSIGLPIALQYPARNAVEIIKHFSVQHPISSNLNVVMAQPLAHNTPAFCLLAYGTDKKYDTVFVANQWEKINEELASLGIKLLTISSDSDPKYNNAMRFHSKLGFPSQFKWFSSAAKADGPFCIQDIEHIITKLRNFFLKTIWNEKKLPFGKNYFIEIKHLYSIMDKFKKDRHELTRSVLNPTDKQNFKSALKMCSKKVTDLLQIYPKYHATVHFLTIMRDINDAFRDRKLSPLERVKKMWYTVFLVRLWRRYISTNSRFTMEKNFLTIYTHACIELNAHSLVQIILYLRKINRPDMFLPHYFGSQQCENIFRLLRSLSPIYSTTINCSTKDAISRLTKIEIQNNIIHSTPNFKFPRHENKNKANVEPFLLPSLEEIVQTIEQCATEAIMVAQKMNLITENDVTDTELLVCKVNPYSMRQNVEETPKQCMKMKINTNTLKLSDFDGMALKDFSASKKCVDENSPYVELRFDNNSKRAVVRKSTFVWMLRPDWQRLSNDRLRRVQCTTKKPIQRKCKKNRVKKKVLMYPIKKPNSKKI